MAEEFRGDRVRVSRAITSDSWGNNGGIIIFLKRV
jgi:hypothetical protein